jgi:HEAT repeat protein
MLGRMENDSAIPHLTRLLSDPEPAVRTSAVSSLGALFADSSASEIIALLDDSEERVRQEALTVLPKLNVSASPELIKKISERMTNDASTDVRMRAASALAKLGDCEQIMPNVRNWLASEDAQTRIAALEMLREIAPYLNHHFEFGSLTPALEDLSVSIRRAAVSALAMFQDAVVDQKLISFLSDPAERVRSAAAAGLHRRGELSRALLLETIEKEGPGIDAALDALPPGNPAALAPLRAYAGREIGRAHLLRKQFASLPASGPAVAMLRERLRMQASLSEGRSIKIVGLFSDTRTMELVRKSMNETNLENRAAALEALETIGDKKLASSIVSLLEEEPQPGDASDVVAMLLKSTDPWLRILAIRATPELGLREFLPLLHQMKSGPDLLLRGAVIGALSQFGEEKQMDILNTVSMLERILLLREIPIFADLSAEDLQLVANIAREEWYPQNTELFHQGEEGNVMFVIVEGNLHVVRMVNGIEQLIAQRGPGDFVGEMAVIESAPRLATLRTQSDVRVLAIDGETFKGILRERPDVSFAVLRNISRRLREMTG